MIKFFRHIRRALLADNRFGRYLLYAAGEIVLVVIGILIALQINNANEARKEDRAVQEVLIEIQEDLMADVVELQTNIKLRTDDYTAQERMVGYFQKKTAYNDQVSADLGHVNLYRPVFSASKGYDLLKELNLGSLKDKELRSLLSQYYERDIPMVHQENYDDKFEFESFWLPYVRKYLSEWKFGDSATPRDYGSLLADQVLRTSLEMNLRNVGNTINAYKNALATAENLLQLINNKNEGND